MVGTPLGSILIVGGKIKERKKELNPYTAFHLPAEIIPYLPANIFVLALKGIIFVITAKETARIYVYIKQD